MHSFLLCSAFMAEGPQKKDGLCLCAGCNMLRDGGRLVGTRGNEGRPSGSCFCEDVFCVWCVCFQSCNWFGAGKKIPRLLGNLYDTFWKTRNLKYFPVFLQKCWLNNILYFQKSIYALIQPFPCPAVSLAIHLSIHPYMRLSVIRQSSLLFACFCRFHIDSQTTLGIAAVMLLNFVFILKYD